MDYFTSGLHIQPDSLKQPQHFPQEGTPGWPFREDSGAWPPNNSTEAELWPGSNASGSLASDSGCRPSPECINLGSTGSSAAGHSYCWTSPRCSLRLSNAGSTPTFDSLFHARTGPESSPARTCRPSTLLRYDSVYSPPSGEAKQLSPESPPVVGLTQPDAATIDNRASPQKPRVPHSVIEKRYRDNLNKQIDRLQATIPQVMFSGDMEDLGVAGCTSSKVAVVATATRWLEQLRTANQQTKQANRSMREQIEGMEEIADCNTCPVVDLAKRFRVMDIIAVS